ncbi:MAG TPA: hypothetical protein DIW30_01545 [Bacteroidales bacterium]|nr:hypothetical protein [Bacteroidales bacterium]
MTNKKQSLLDAIIDLGIECCNMDNHGTPLTRDIILCKDKHENVQMTRTIIVNQIHLLGYTHSTIAIKFGRTTQAVCKILNDAHPAFYATSACYRLATRELSARCEDYLQNL